MLRQCGEIQRSGIKSKNVPDLPICSGRSAQSDGNKLNKYNQLNQQSFSSRQQRTHPSHADPGTQEDNGSTPTVQAPIPPTLHSLIACEPLFSTNTKSRPVHMIGSCAS